MKKLGKHMLFLALEHARGKGQQFYAPTVPARFIRRRAHSSSRNGLFLFPLDIVIVQQGLSVFDEKGTLDRTLGMPRVRRNLHAVKNRLLRVMVSGLIEIVRERLRIGMAHLGL